jgi:hypothetical protein
MAVLLGPAVSTLFAYNLKTTHYTDTRTYLGLAKFQLNQHPVRKYRVIVPALAALVNIGSPIWQRLAPTAFPGDFSTPFSFFVVNLFFMSLLGLVIYKYILNFGIGRLYAILGLLVMLTCRYTADFTGLAMIESSYFLVVAYTLFAIKTQNSKALIACIFIGPFVKEAFIFIAPLIFFFGHIDKRKQIAYFLLSGALVFGFRYLFDIYSGAPVAEGINSDVGHIVRIKDNLKEMVGIQGIYQICMVGGLWFSFIIATFTIKPAKELFGKLDRLHLMFLISVFVQMVLSGNFARMLFSAMPLICLIVAFCLTVILKKLYMNSNRSILQQCI